MLLLSIILLSIFLFNSFALFNGDYSGDLDQFMYFGSRLLNGELAWTKEFDDKSPVLQFLFSIPAYFNNLNVWLFINIIFSIIGSLYLFSIIKILINDIFKKNYKFINPTALFTSSFYLFLILYFNITEINILTVNLLIVSIYFQIKSNKKFRINEGSFFFYFLIAALFSSISISIRPYLLFSIILNNFWIFSREPVVVNNKFKTKFSLSDLLKIQILWILLISILIFSFNILPYLLTDNLSIFINTMRLNSIEYFNNSPINTLIQQLLFFRRNLSLVFIYFFILLLVIVSIIKIKNKLIYLKEKEEVKLRQCVLDIFYLFLIAPLSIELLILSRHFFKHYLFLFSPYLCMALALFLGLCFSVYNKQKLTQIIYFVVTLIFIFSQHIILIKENNMQNINLQNKNNDFTILKSIIINEKNENKKIGFLFPFNNFYHWKFNESRKGFPLEAVFKYISLGKFDKVLDKYPDLEYDYLLPRKNDLCKTVENYGPELIFIKNDSYEHKKFLIDCLSSSPMYTLDRSYKNLDQTNWSLFRNYIK